MTNVVKFPCPDKVRHRLVPGPTSVAREEASPSPAVAGGSARLVDGLITFLWVIAVLLWTPIKWVLSLYTLAQLVRLLFNWNLPNGAWFVGSFLVLSGLTYFVSYFKPKSA